MSLATKTSLRFSRRLAPTSALHFTETTSDRSVISTEKTSSNININININSDINSDNTSNNNNNNNNRRQSHLNYACHHHDHHHSHYHHQATKLAFSSFSSTSKSSLIEESLERSTFRRLFSTTISNNNTTKDNIGIIDDDEHVQKNANSTTTTTTTTIDHKQEQQPTLMERTDKNIIERMYEKYSMSQQTNRILMAESLFQAATSQASDPRWYGPGRIERDFRSYQAILTMHIWFLHKRLVGDEDDPHNAALIQEELFDILWIDSSNRMRAHGVNEMLINKNLQKVQQYTFMHMFHYDHCYTGDLLDNPTDRLDALKMTIKTHILLLPSLSNDDNEDEHDNDNDNGNHESADEELLQKHIAHDDQAERLAWYIETQFQNIIHDLPDSFFRKARIAWVDLPSFDHMIDGTTGKELPKQIIDDPEDVLPLDWTKSIANDGSYYYWNLKTREAQWDRPE